MKYLSMDDFLANPFQEFAYGLRITDWDNHRVTEFFNALRDPNCKLTKLYLSWIKIGDEGARALAEALPYSGIITLDLGRNAIGSDRRRGLAEARAIQTQFLVHNKDAASKCAKALEQYNSDGATAVMLMLGEDPHLENDVNLVKLFLIACVNNNLSISEFNPPSRAETVFELALQSVSLKSLLQQAREKLQGPTPEASTASASAAATVSAEQRV